MLPPEDFIQRFLTIQQDCMDATLTVVEAAKPGVDEKSLAEQFDSRMRQRGLSQAWYPTLICAGPFSGEPLTRRNHLPSGDVKLRSEDIVILDATPLDKTVWGNWTVTKSVGFNPFYRQLCSDVFSVTLQGAADVLTGKAQHPQQIYSSVIDAAEQRGLVSIDPRGNVGHSIFQVPAGQTVDQTPITDRLFIDAMTTIVVAPILLSVEPELARVNPSDGVRYGGKFQFIIPIGYGNAGEVLIQNQLAFFQRFAAHENNPSLTESLHNFTKQLGQRSGREILNRISPNHRPTL